jgi:hypothetical protein
MKWTFAQLILTIDPALEHRNGSVWAYGTQDPVGGEYRRGGTVTTSLAGSRRI